MTLHRLINWMLALLIVAVVCLATAMDGPSDHQAWLDAQQALLDAQAAAGAEARLEQAARRICGENATWSRRDGSLQCLTKQGRPQTVAQVQP